MTFPEKLRELRAASRMTQQALADRAGMPLGTLRNFEQGIRTPMLATAAKLAKALGVSLGAFDDCDFEGEGEQERPARRGRPKKEPLKAVETAGGERRRAGSAGKPRPGGAL
jgi:transcriptional regulator with XRE-family HTH domain